jgi:hypothetical protein
MPTITRWFRVTHDINGDPEMWELREQFTDRALAIWLECLSIADRNSGIVGPDTDQTRNQLASKCRTSRAKVASVLGWCRVKGWLVSDEHIRIAKWSKYNKTRDVDQTPSETTPIQTRHDIPVEEKNKRAQAPIVLPEWLPQEAWFGFCEHRKQIRKPITRRGSVLALRKLEQLKNDGHDPKAVLDQSVANGWTGIFPIKGGRQNERNTNEPKGFASVRQFLDKHNRE